MKPVNLFLITAIISVVYVIVNLFNGRDYDNVFWFALVTAFFNFGLWIYMRKFGDQQDES